jgi:acyl-CoA dehydrogenase
MDCSVPQDVTDFITRLDAFIEAEIKPIEADNPEYFDHRREFSRTDLERGGIATREWREIMYEARRRADKAGFYRYPLPAAVGGSDGSNLAMAVIREHLAGLGPGLHAELSHEYSVVANLPLALVLLEYGTAEQKEQYLERLVSGQMEFAFGLTEPDHGSDATWLETRAVKDGDDWIINGAKRFNSAVDTAEIDLVFARTSGQDGKADGITAFIVPTDAPGFSIPYYHYTFNMPSDHAEVHLKDVRVPNSAIVGELGRGLDCAQLFVTENRVRQAASSLGAAQFCIDAAVEQADKKIIFGQKLRDMQGVQWQLVELQTEAEMLRSLLYKTAWELDTYGKTAVTGKVSMVNLRGNRLACDASDRAMQVFGGVGYTRHVPFEFIYRHHRRYRITEGTEEVQLRRIASTMWNFKS